jgi:hypothetical protein
MTANSFLFYRIKTINKTITKPFWQYVLVFADYFIYCLHLFLPGLSIPYLIRQNVRPAKRGITRYYFIDEAFLRTRKHSKTEAGHSTG